MQKETQVIVCYFRVDIAGGRRPYLLDNALKPECCADNAIHLLINCAVILNQDSGLGDS
jgi:hypothetical protein